MGELTYHLTEIARRYIETHGESFARYAEVIAALESTKLELYRQQVAPYEDKKKAVNGGVW